MDGRLFDSLLEALRGGQSGATRVFDLVLALTLSDAGVETLYTRNVKDFVSIGEAYGITIVDPIEGV